MSDEPEHLSIGEVLALLQTEFPDVTISKIRFLENQGLIDPERTPSGYRKFYALDIDRLRWILRQQRDHFLPLKVIKARLEQGGEIDFASTEAIQPSLWTEQPAGRPLSVPGGDTPFSASGGAGVSGGSSYASAGGSGNGADAGSVARNAVTSAGGGSPAGADGSSAAGTDSGSEGSGDAARNAADWLAKLQESPRLGGGADRRGAAEPSRGMPALPVTSGPRVGRDELAEVTGASVEAIDSMVTFGLLAPVMIGGEPTFDNTSVAVVGAVAKFLERGVEPRHLRMFKNAADREAGFYEQMILPLLKQRNPRSRDQAVQSLAEMMVAGDELSRSLIRQALRPHLTD